MKAKERIIKYGIAAYRQMVGAGAKPVSYYKSKYPEAPVKLPVKAPEISRRQLKYWKGIKNIAKGHKTTIQKARAIYKRERSKGDGLRLVRRGSGWQLWMLGLYRNTKIEAAPQLQTKLFGKRFGKLFGINGKTELLEKMDGWSYLRNYKNHAESLNECIRDAQGGLGGSNWELVKVLKEKWYRFYGVEKKDFTEDHP